MQIIGGGGARIGNVRGTLYITLSDKLFHFHLFLDKCLIFDQF